LIPRLRLKDKFTVNSLLFTVPEIHFCRILAEFDDFWSIPKISPVFFTVPEVNQNLRDEKMGDVAQNPAAAPIARNCVCANLVNVKH